ncbi:FixH family protein [Actinokineospora spheciospongiae]|uniref:FixH family protein n=1 Tax=Actinokineospora spheciospongiae TaxID=909613 RepID=UPI000D90CBD9|nr:FixH family protein [Actinokineospora spheciospongiae]PWW51966.1 YtkA-like protein [Actinokineospora spheciospongiae]
MTRTGKTVFALVVVAVLAGAVLLWRLGSGDGPVELSGGTDSYALRVRFDGPTTVGESAVSIEVADTAGTPVSADEVTVEPVMPEMGHAEPAVSAAAEGVPGRYRATGARLTMAGTWEITVTVRSGGKQEAAVFPIAVRS